MLTALTMLGMMQTSTSLVTPVGLIPEAEDVRMQTITRQAGEVNWPFAADTGLLICVPSLGQRVVFFYPEETDETADIDAETAEAEGVPVTTDPMMLMMFGYGKEKHFAQNMTIEDKIRRLGPYVTLGKKLCDQPKGTILGPSEL